ncbi:sigma-70 family RNA polymerase sigma factor [Virgibacillus sp. W0430]|uniref:sigma-70 family RNA polymerase sigma factor n=1 Tax=Virgibacillus sp. W0430 TaxID=3391580 RepID=UPI003F44D0DB
MSAEEKLTFEQIFKQNERRIYFYIHKLNVQDPHREFYQEGLVAMWNAYEKYEPDKGPLATYFNYMIRNRMIDLIRKKSREQRAEKEVVHEEKKKIDLGNHMRKSDSPSIIHGSADLYVTDMYLWEQVKRGLTEKQWKWVYYSIVEGMTYKEIAKQEQTTVEAVKSWGRQARKNLRKMGLFTEN